MRTIKIFIYAYKYALKSIFHRLSIEFASNLHRLCNGGSLEENRSKALRLKNYL